MFCCEGTTLISYLGHEKIVYVPNGITAIGRQAFARDYGRAQEVYLPESVMSIEMGAFSGCKSLRRIVGPNIMKIGNRAFAEANRLEYVEFPALKTYGANAFFDCEELSEENIIIPDDAVFEGR